MTKYKRSNATSRQPHIGRNAPGATLIDATSRAQHAKNNLAGAMWRAQHYGYSITGATCKVLRDESNMTNATEWAQHDECSMTSETRWLKMSHETERPRVTSLTWAKAHDGHDSTHAT